MLLELIDDPHWSVRASVPFNPRADDRVRAAILRSTDELLRYLLVHAHSLDAADSTGNGLAVDDVITAGSPGMNVDHVADLRTPADHVWAGAAPGDPTTAAGIALLHDLALAG